MIYQFDLSTARSTFQTFVVSDAKAWILRADGPFDLLLDGGEFLPWPSGLTGEVDHCCIPNGTMGIRNVASSGLVIIYTSSEFCLNLSSGLGGSTSAALLSASRAKIIAHAVPTFQNSGGPRTAITVIGLTSYAGLTDVSAAGNYYAVTTITGGSTNVEFDATGLRNRWALVAGAVGSAIQGQHFGQVGNGPAASKAWPLSAVLMTPAANLPPGALASVGTFFVETDLQLNVIADGGASRRLVAGLTLAGAQSLTGGNGGNLWGLLWVNNISPNWLLIGMKGMLGDPEPFQVVAQVDTGVQATAQTVPITARLELVGTSAGGYLRALINGTERARITGPISAATWAGYGAAALRHALATAGNRGPFALKDTAAANNDIIELYAGAVNGIFEGWIAP